MKDKGLNTKQVQQAMLSFASCFGAVDQSFTYVSTPITSGKYFLEWLKISADVKSENQPINPLSIETFVYERNIRKAEALVQRMRSRFPNRVIDPTQLSNIPDWSQNDYHLFWIQVVRKFVSSLVMANGWEFSTGSTLEFLTALELGIPILDEELAPISKELALQKLIRARSEFQAVEYESPTINNAIETLRSITWREDNLNE